MRSVLAVGLSVLAAGASAQERVVPSKGVFLVAEGEIDGGPFYQSVVLLLTHDAEGTLGVILNRRTKIPLSEVRPDLAADEPEPRLYFGGPVGLEGLLVLFRSDTAVEDAQWVMDDLYYSGSPAVLEALLEDEERKDEPRLFIGHSGWAPGQLESELRRGSWDVVRADVASVFGPDSESLWERLTMSDRIYARSRRLAPHGSPWVQRRAPENTVSGAPLPASRP